MPNISVQCRGLDQHSRGTSTLITFPPSHVRPPRLQRWKPYTVGGKTIQKLYLPRIEPLYSVPTDILMYQLGHRGSDREVYITNGICSHSRALVV